MAAFSRSSRTRRTLPRSVSRLKRRHLLMLILAAEILGAGFANAGRYRPPAIIVEQTVVTGHIIT